MIRKLAATVAAAVAALVLAAPPAPAYPYEEFAGVGAEATQDVMRALSEEYSLDHPDTAWTSIDAGSTNQMIQALGSCPGVVFSPSNAAPAASGAGIQALVASTNGCVDYARSTFPLPYNSSLTQIRLGGDAVSWAALPPSEGGHAPANLSLTDLRKIYRCEVTDWSQVPGGTPGPIVRYYNASDTFTFTRTVLGFDPWPTSTGSCTTPPVYSHENHGNEVPAADRPGAILPYSKAAWTAQSDSAVTGVPDSRGGFVLGTVDATAPGAQGFIGYRDVFNVYKGSGSGGGSGGGGETPVFPVAPPELVAFLNWASANEPLQNAYRELYGFTP